MAYQIEKNLCKMLGSIWEAQIVLFLKMERFAGISQRDLS
jgi:hypothetical protein